MWPLLCDRGHAAGHNLIHFHILYILLNCESNNCFHNLLFSFLYSFYIFIFTFEECLNFCSLRNFLLVKFFFFFFVSTHGPSTSTIHDVSWSHQGMDMVSCLSIEVVSDISTSLRG